MALTLAAVLLLAGNVLTAEALVLSPEPKEASPYTAEANEQVYALLDFSDERELENAERGLIAAPQSLEIKDDAGNVVWSQAAYDFLDQDAPETANPSLWRNTQLNHICGLFEVMDGIYQVRGYDMSNITFIKGDTGWIVFDPLMTKAVYQKYMGWYDANPVHLGELAPTERAKKFVEYFGDVDAVLARAKEDFDKGEYQWVAELTNMLVFADPDNMDARYLCADALEQLAYQAESGTWRNAYLCAVQELRFGVNRDMSTRASSGGGLITHMTPEMIMQYLGIYTDSNKIQDLNFTANIILPQASYVLVVRDGVVLYEEGSLHERADAVWRTNLAGLFAIAQNNREGIDSLVTQERDSTLLDKLMEGNVLAENDWFFPIVEP